MRISLLFKPLALPFRKISDAEKTFYFYVSNFYLEDYSEMIKLNKK